MNHARARRVAVIGLVILTLIVCARALSPARGASREAQASRGARARASSVARRLPPAAPAISFAIEERGGVLAGATTLHRTLQVRGAPPWSGELVIDWEARMEGAAPLRGRERVSVRKGGLARLVLSVPLPPIDRPAGLDLVLQAKDAGALVGEATFPFTLYPAALAGPLLDLFGRARAALYDPGGRAGRVLSSLGLAFEEVVSLEDLALFEGDLIVVGPGGFTRGREELGPILAARARTGMRVLILDQPNLPATLSEELRLWPSFRASAGTSVLISTEHPVLRGLAAEGGAGYLSAALGRVRPLLPPTRGNFRVLAEVRVASGPSWQEGVAILEIPIGSGTVLAAQASLCADFDRDPRPRILLANALAYLLGDRPRIGRAFLYGGGTDSLPLCLRHLAPYVQTAPSDLEGVELLLAPGDWQAPRSRTVAGLPPLARVDRFLHEGGTLVLLDPQALVLDYLARLTGSEVYFEETQPAPLFGTAAASLPMLEGIAPEDLDLLKRAPRAEFRLRPRSGPGGVETILLAPGLARYRVGRGTLVALTLPDASECPSPPTSSLLARLLTNLGVPLDPGPGIDVRAITRLNEPASP